MGAPGSGPTAYANVQFADDRPIYERQPNETDKAWSAFLAYRALGPERTQAKTVEALQKPARYIGTIAAWSRQYGWRQRMVEYDRVVDLETRKAKVEELTRAHREMLLVATSMWKLAAKDLMRWHKKLDKAPQDQPVLSPRDVQSLADTGLKLQRVLMGEPDQITEHRHEVTVEETRGALRGLLMDKEALQAMDLVAAKLDGGTGNGNGGIGDGSIH